MQIIFSRYSNECVCLLNPGNVEYCINVCVYGWQGGQALMEVNPQIGGSAL